MNTHHPLFQHQVMQHQAISLTRTGSQETLVGVPAHQPVEGTILIFSRDDMRQTTLFPRDGGPLYVVNSFKSFTRTTVRRVEIEATPLAVIERRGVLPDRITFTGQERVHLKRWLKPMGGAPTSPMFPVTFESEGESYIWDVSDTRIMLYSARAPNVPIAWFQPSEHSSVNGVTRIYAAYLALQPEALEIRDLVVISFLVLEQDYRECGRGTHARNFTGFFEPDFGGHFNGLLRPNFAHSLPRGTI
ncbi:hypothetical protein BD779DRAFT_1524597 [Infundibulicybe gibba]|nr:hypothetical protein BD779DRAFT_1524597 [Infundibulicybe gibba]